MTNWAVKKQDFTEGISKLLTSYQKIPPNHQIGLAKKTSNLFRGRNKDNFGLDVSGLTEVISIDPLNRTAEVAGMCTYETLVAETLKYGLLPNVVPELKTITLGGAVTGLGIESSSFKLGLPHEAILEMDLLAADGNIITATPTNEYKDLFYGFPNSYGSLGYATRIKIQLEKALPYVELVEIRFNDTKNFINTLNEYSTNKIYVDNSGQSRKIDFLDAVAFTKTENYIVLGFQTEKPGKISDYTNNHIYYRSLQHDISQTPKTDYLTIKDYIWRWDTDWFWCSRAFGTQNKKIRKIWPRKWLRSDFYWKIVNLDRKYNFGDKISVMQGGYPQERVVQDIEVPAENAQKFLDWFLDNILISPIWICPLNLAEKVTWPLYPLKFDKTYQNFGFWSSVDIKPDSQPAEANKKIEAKVTELGGHKSLYSEAFYSEDEFNKLYGGSEYKKLKQKYDKNNRFTDLYAKVVGNK